MWQTDRRLRNTLSHHLPRAEEICARLKINEHRRKPGHGLGTNHIQPGHASQQILLHGNRDHQFHFLGGEPQCLGLDLHIGRGELRQDIDWHPAELGDTECHQCNGNREHQELKLHTCSYYRTHHSLVPPCIKNFELDSTTGNAMYKTSIKEKWGGEGIMIVDSPFL